MTLQTKQVLITVKAYPNPSKKYSETVCCAGIELETRSWIRLYPIQYRDLESSKRFAEYDIVAVNCEKAKRDHRVESYQVDQDSIRVLRHLDTKDNWRARKKIVLPTASSSFCDIQAMVKQNLSLGIYPLDFYYGFRCAGRDDCPGHRLKIVDWEMGQAYRKWREESESQEELLRKIESRWLTEICSHRNDVYLYVGNMQRLREQFLVLGIFYPRK